MYHEDGIEVYLKPAGEENIKFAEFPVLDHDQTASDEQLNSRRVVLARAGDFAIVVRFRARFNMYSANALAISIKTGQFSHEMPTRWIVQRSNVYWQDDFTMNYYSPYRSNGNVNTARSHKEHFAMAEVDRALAGDFDQTMPAELSLVPTRGSIVVQIIRVTATFRDDSVGGLQDLPSKSKYGPGNPAQPRPLATEPVVPLASRNGKPYFFEFQYRSDDFVQRAHSSALLGAGTGRNVQDTALIPDADYVRIRDEEKLEKERISAAYERRQAATTAAEKSTTSASSDTVAQQTSATKPRKKRTEPQFCNCGEEGHRTPVKRSTTTARQPLGLPRKPKPALADGGNTTAEDPEDAVDDKTLPDAPVCGDCKKLKVPRSRRRAFLGKWHRKSNDSPSDENDGELATNTEPVTHDATAPEQDNQLEGGPSTNEVVPSQAQSVELDTSGTTRQSNETPVEDHATLARSEAQLAIWESLANTKEAKDALPGQTQYADAWQNEILRVSRAQAALVHAVEAAAQDPAVAPSGERKRPTDLDADQRQAKKQRIDIDLTNDDDDPVEVKMERAEQYRNTASVSVSDTADEQEIRDRMEETKLQLEEVQLKQKLKGLERELRAKQRRQQAGASIKQEAVIKIEDLVQHGDLRGT